MVTQEEGHTGFFIPLPSAVRALIFLARRIQPFLPLVDHEVDFFVPTIQSFSTRWALFIFITWYLNEFSDGSNLGHLGQHYNVGEKPTVIRTLILIAMQSHQA